MANPSPKPLPGTTAGDLIYVDLDGNHRALAIGNAGEQLAVSGGLPTWDASASGTMAAQDASAVAITGGTIEVVTIGNTDINGPLITGGQITALTVDLAVADGGTGSSTAAGARTNLGLGSMAIQNANQIVTAGPITLGAAGGPTVQSGTGSPEGVLTAPQGSLFLRTDGGATTTLYIKTSGAGNTGWTAK